MKNKKNQNAEDSFFNLILSISNLNEIDDKLTEKEHEVIEKESLILADKFQKLFSQDDNENGGNNLSIVESVENIDRSH